MTVIAQPPSPILGVASILGFLLIVMTLLYIFREKRTVLPKDIPYNYEGKITNPKIDNQIEQNAYLHTLAPSHKGAMYGLHNDKRKKK